MYSHGLPYSNSSLLHPGHSLCFCYSGSHSHYKRNLSIAYGNLCGLWRLYYFVWQLCHS